MPTKDKLIKNNKIVISISMFFKKIAMKIVNLFETGKEKNVRAKQKIEMMIIDLEKNNDKNKK